jgi:hypothetical protein
MTRHNASGYSNRTAALPTGSRANSRTSVAIALAVAFVACHSNPSEKEGAARDAAAAVPSAPMNATPLPAASVDAFVNPGHLPPYTGPTGSVEGTIRVDGPPSPNMTGVDFSSCPAAAKTYAKVFREGPPGPDGSRPLADALVAVTGYAGYFVPERQEGTKLAIDDCAFGARTIAMTFGQRLEIANKTPDLWAPSLAQTPLPVLMMATSHGDPVRLYPPRPGYFTLIDKEKHSWAQADVYALLHPLHAVSDSSGHYRIDNVPVGKLKVNARLRVLQRDVSADVEILANVVKTVDLVLHYTPTIEVAPDAAAMPHVIP